MDTDRQQQDGEESNMEAVAILATIFGGIILILAVIGGTILTAMRLRGGISRKRQRYDADEAKMIQELFQGLAKMEERTEALETLLLDKGRKESKYEKA